MFVASLCIVLTDNEDLVRQETRVVVTAGVTGWDAPECTLYMSDDRLILLGDGISKYAILGSLGHNDAESK